MTVGNTYNRSGRSDRLFRHTGNAQIVDLIVQPGGYLALAHPNRFLEKFRASNRSNRRFHDAT